MSGIKPYDGQDSKLLHLALPHHMDSLVNVDLADTGLRAPTFRGPLAGLVGNGWVLKVSLESRGAAAAAARARGSDFRLLGSVPGSTALLTVFPSPSGLL